jgi:HPt (histidine-containing phosphotransfer) domain-containing protein
MGVADSKYIDLAEGLPRVANNEMLYKRLLAKFAASIDVDAFEAAIAGRDFTAAGEIVHAAKGVAGNLSLKAFYGNSVVLMEQLRGGAEPVQENVDAFTQLYKETVAAIDAYIG